MNPEDEYEFDYEDDSDDFIPCSKCDGHDACEDFGCAIELGLERMVRKSKLESEMTDNDDF